MNLKSKNILLHFITFATLIILCFGGIFLAKCFTVTEKNETETTANNESLWTEKEIQDEAYKILATFKDFNLCSIIEQSDFIFSGEIIERKEYEVQWTDENDEKWGTYPSSVIDVRVENVYYGNSFLNGDTIKVYYPNSLSACIDGTFKLNNGDRFIFITQNLDDDFIQEKEEKNPDDRFQQEKYADVYIQDSRYNVIKLENENVIVNKEFINQESSLSHNIFNYHEITCDDNIPYLTSNEFVVINNDEFIEPFNSLIKDNKRDLVFE